MILKYKIVYRLFLGMVLFTGGCVAGVQAEEGLFPGATVMAPPPQPTKLPEFNFANLQGGSLKSSETKGKVLIIRFWATW